MGEPPEPQGPVSGREEPATPPEPPAIHSHIAYFVVPLSEPIGLPDKHRVVRAAPTPGEWYRRHEAEGLPPPPPVHMAASLIFHHTESGSVTAAVIAELFTFADEAFSGSKTRLATQATPVEANAPTLLMPCTFVEMAVAFDLKDGESGGVSEAFDAGLACVREVQRAYYLVRRRPIRLATREAMPCMIPYGVQRLFSEDEAPTSTRVSLLAFVLNTNLDRETRDEELTSNQLRGLTQGLWQQSHGGFVTDYLEFVRETEVAVMADGSYRAAILFAATSCEVLLDNLLAHMLWEEGQRPEEAAALFDPTASSITARVKKHYHSRLGGQWSVDQPGPLYNWFRDVARQRNRVVHGGYEPTFDEAHAAADAATALGIHLGDALAGRTYKYPRTALALPGEVGIRRRGKWSNQLEAIWKDPQEVDWIATFARWRTAMQKTSKESFTYLSPSTDAAWVYAIIRPGGHVQWVVHDRQAGMAAAVDLLRIQNLSTLQAEGLDRWRVSLRNETQTSGSSRSAHPLTCAFSRNTP